MRCTVLIQEHQGHEVSTFTEGLDRHEHSMDDLVDRCRSRCGRLREHIDLIGRCETSIERAEVQIRDTAIDSIANIRRREREVHK